MENPDLGFYFHHTQLRVTDAQRSVEFYERHFGMKLIHVQKMDQEKKTVHYLHGFRSKTDMPAFLNTPSAEEAFRSAGSSTPESEKFLWSLSSGHVLALAHSWETSPDFKIHNGNSEPYRGFGHIAFNVRDLQGFFNKLKEDGVKFQLELGQGKMKDLAFALDPDGYWIELLARDTNVFSKEVNDLGWAELNYSQTMIRVKDQKKSRDFYRLLHMQNMRHASYSSFDLDFLYSPPATALPPNADKEAVKQEIMSEEPQIAMRLPKEFEYAVNNRMFRDVSVEVDGERPNWHRLFWRPCLELTYNHGTEKDADFKYYNGNEPPGGFAHIGFLCNDVQAACDMLHSRGFEILTWPKDSAIAGLAMVKDPDGYWVQLIPRGFKFSRKM